MKITIETYYLFKKHGSELLWVSDPKREHRPKGTNEKTDNEFIVLEQLDENMELLHNEFYNDSLKEECSDKIQDLKNKVTDEVFNLIQEKFKK